MITVTLHIVLLVTGFLYGNLVSHKAEPFSDKAYRQLIVVTVAALSISLILATIKITALFIG